MKYLLRVGYYGVETVNGASHITNKKHGEPNLTINKIIDFFNLEDTEFMLDTDLDMVWQGQKREEKEKIIKIWKEIVSKKWHWRGLKPKFEELLKLGGGLLPIIFNIKSDKLEIEVIDGEHTFGVVYEDLEKLKEFNEILIREDNLRVTPVGRRYSDHKSYIEKTK